MTNNVNNKPHSPLSPSHEDNHVLSKTTKPWKNKMRQRLGDISKKNKNNLEEHDDLSHVKEPPPPTSPKLNTFVQYFTETSSALGGYFSNDKDFDDENNSRENNNYFPTAPKYANNIQSEMPGVRLFHDHATTPNDSSERCNLSERLSELKESPLSLGTLISTTALEGDIVENEEENDRESTQESDLNSTPGKSNIHRRFSPPKIVHKRPLRINSNFDEDHYPIDDEAPLFSSSRKTSQRSRLKMSPREITYSKRLTRKKKRGKRGKTVKSILLPMETIAEVDLEEDASVLSWGQAASSSSVNNSHPTNDSVGASNNSSTNAISSILHRKLLPRPLKYLVYFTLLLTVVLGVWIGFDAMNSNARNVSGANELENSGGLKTNTFPFSFQNQTTGPSSFDSGSSEPNPERMFSLAPSYYHSTGPSLSPSAVPSSYPSSYPSYYPSSNPFFHPSQYPTHAPSYVPTLYSSSVPSVHVSSYPSSRPSRNPTSQPSTFSSSKPSLRSSLRPSVKPSLAPSADKSIIPSITHDPVSFFVLPEITFKPDDQSRIVKQLAKVPKNAPFIVHMSEFNSDLTLCDESVYSKVKTTIRSTIDMPVFLLPSDNDYVDCPNPSEAWSFWQEYWGNFDQLWDHSLQVKRQSNRPENFAFFMNDFILFLGVHIISGRSDQEDHALLMMDNLEWTLTNIRHHQSIGLESVVIFGHTRPHRMHDDYFDKLGEAVADMDISIMYLHGDTQSWNVTAGHYGADNIMIGHIKAGANKILKVTARKEKSMPFQFTYQ